MMRKIALGALVAVGLVGAAIAADDPMAGVYGNTVVVTNSKGEKTKLWIKADGTYAVETSKGEKGTGKWALKENNTKYCSTADLPANAPKETPAPKEACSEFKGCAQGRRQVGAEATRTARISPSKSWPA